MAENRVFFIINRYAGTRFQSAVEGRIINACARLNLECTIEYTMHKGHATELARQAVQDGFTRIFAMGGDGTVNEVAQSLVHTHASLGIIPRGSGNGLARHLRIPLGIEKALQLLGAFQVIPMDTLMINQQLSVNVSGIGFDAHVASKFGKNGKRGLLNYIRLVLQEYKGYHEFEMEVTVEGKTWRQQTFIIALANSSQFGNNARVAPTASVVDGQLDVCIIRKPPLLSTVNLVSKLFTGRTNLSAWVNTIPASRFSATSEHPIPFHIDGEAHPPTREFQVEIQPASLKMIVPAIGGLI